jgi:hypothetical protein
MATLIASSCGINKGKIYSQLSKIKPVTGRLECVANLKNKSKHNREFEQIFTNKRFMNIIS